MVVSWTYLLVLIELKRCSSCCQKGQPLPALTAATPVVILDCCAYSLKGELVKYCHAAFQLLSVEEPGHEGLCPVARLSGRDPSGSGYQTSNLQIQKPPFHTKKVLLIRLDDLLLLQRLHIPSSNYDSAPSSSKGRSLNVPSLSLQIYCLDQSQFGLSISLGRRGRCPRPWRLVCS